MEQLLPVLDEPSESLDPALFGNAFNASPEGLALASHGRILHANPAFAGLFGYSDPNEIAGRRLAEFRMDADSYDCVRISGADAARISNGNPLCEFLGRRKDGSSIRMESTCSAFSSRGRKFVVLAVRDVTQRERRRMIRDSERRFRAILDAAPMGIVQCELDGRILEANPAIKRMLGYSPEELRGTPFRNLTHPDNADRYARAFHELVEGKRDTCELEIRYLGKADASGWIHLKVSLVRGPESDPQFAIAMAEDITDRKRSEQRLREAQKMEVVGRLVGGVAHDFNNLLTGIMLYCDLLVAGLQHGSRLRHHAEEIRMAGEQGAALIQQLLAISRQQVVEPRVLCLNQTIAGGRNLLSRLIGENIELRLQLDEHLGNVKMDPAQLQQILFNLVLNGRDAIAASGRIIVETSSCEIRPPASAVPPIAIPGVMLAVTDTGCGMSAETRSHLFEPFFTTKTPGRGNGLGLATVFRIVKNNGGTIQVESELGQGARFTVRLPRIPDPPIAQRCEPTFSPVATGETVLLVEDNLTVRKAAHRILSECGYQVLEAPTGAEAINVARAHPHAIQLLVADLVMPGMSGRELGRTLRAERPELPILYMSGYEPRNSGTEEVGEPVVFFHKPFTGAALLEKFDRCWTRASQQIRRNLNKEARTTMTVAEATLPATPQIEGANFLNLLIVDDERAIRDACREVAQSLGFNTFTADSAEQAYQQLESQGIDAVLLDLRLPGAGGLEALNQIKSRRPDAVVVVVTGYGTVQSAVQAMKNGAYDYVTKPFSLDELRVLLDRLVSHLKLKTENRMLREKIKSKQGFGSIIGRAPEMEKLYRIIAKAAQSTHPVLVLGESGTGKELVARSIHFSGPFRDKPFIPVDCGSLVPTLIESELFGYVKGAFTGAMHAKEGLLAIAEGGTVFLDEVGELPVDLQAKLLRAIQEKEIRPVGSTRRIPINVRILAATNRDLEQAVSQGSFRRDLYFRLNVLSLRIPPLRERRQDIPILAAHFLDRLSRSCGQERTLSDDALKAMLAYDWPGNVRELENCLERGCAFTTGPMLHLGDLPAGVSNLQATGSLGSGNGTNKIMPMAELEKQTILNTIAQLNGDKLLAARLLGVGKTTLYRKLKEYSSQD